ncbi:quaternary ammonium compound efflux SMR transporter SugE [Pelodictyon phaeoclathratiforme]|jgi:quaternary ammonium compound-resistance protein SugE|uniref:Guanidinium exporter n=1 Tax=Pelodictyon phaeoclathratiforme (strain DSM 5477 / BU-1) TaxID=324925 RepID=B4SEG3_PELPB|nr:small multidrug resistance protein [Pelodictyon phaeoclathratiforme BU-1]
MSISWIFLIIAGCLECGWAVGIKYTEGFSRPIPSLLTASAMIASFWLLSLAMKTIPVGTAYAVWTGIGATGVAIVGMLFLDEPRDIARILCLLLILSGVIGLKIFSGGMK